MKTKNTHETIILICFHEKPTKNMHLFILPTAKHSEAQFGATINDYILKFQPSFLIRMSAKDESKKGEIDWSKIGFQVAICSVSHPVTQARVS